MTKKLISLMTAVALLTIAAPAQAAPAETLIIEPDTVHPMVEPCYSSSGKYSFTVSGTGFKKDERIAVTVGDLEYDDTRADAKGRVEAAYAVLSQPSGTYDVVLTGAKGSSAEGELTQGWSACRSVRNGKLKIGGAGFEALDEVELTLDGEVVETTESGEDGRFEMTVPCPRGSHDAEVMDSTGRDLSFADFTC